MLFLNLVPPSYQKRARVQKLTSVGRILLLWIFFEVLVVSIVLLVSQIILQNVFISTVNNSSLVTQSPINLRTDVVKLNQSLDEYRTIQQNFSYLTPSLFAIFNATPTESIALEKISLESKQEQLNISGIAKTREDLLAYQKHLQELPFTKNFELPIKALLDKTDVHFSFSIPLVKDTIF